MFVQQHCWNNNEQHCLFNNIVEIIMNNIVEIVETIMNNIVRSTAMITVVTPLFNQQCCNNLWDFYTCTRNVKTIDKTDNAWYIFSPFLALFLLFSPLQRITSVAEKYSLGLDLRRAAYVLALEKVHNTYASAGLVTFWEDRLELKIILLLFLKKGLFNN